MQFKFFNFDIKFIFSNKTLSLNKHNWKLFGRYLMMFNDLQELYT